MIFLDPKYTPELDRALCNEGGRTVTMLMGLAGEAVAAEARDMSCDCTSALILCGPGNNGGDGFAAGLELILRAAWMVTAIEIEGYGEARAHFRSAFLNAGGKVYPLKALTHEQTASLINDSDIIIDGIFGAGGGRPLPDSIVELSEAVARAKRPVLAIDIPTGIDGAWGEAVPGAFHADRVCMLSTAKPGLYSFPAREFSGELKFNSIGVDDGFILQRFYTDFSVSTDESAAALVPRRAAQSHKGSFGRGLLVCGSKRYRGAAILSLSGALRTGVGIACLASCEEVISSAVTVRPEATFIPLSDFEDVINVDEIYRITEGYDALLIGCGATKSEGLRQLIYRILETEGAPAVIDADGINSLAIAPAESRERLRAAKRQILLTPHPLEFARIAELDPTVVQSSRMKVAAMFARECGCTLILKGAASVVASAEGKLCIIDAGSPALAHGGTGDVLAGACLSFAAQGLPLFDAAVAAAHIHGRAGERLAKTYSDAGVLAGDLPEEMAKFINDII